MRSKTRLVGALSVLIAALTAPLASVAEPLELSWVGCGITRNAFMADLAEAYKQETGVIINISGGGATKGIRSIATKQADIGGSCRFRLEESMEEANTRMIPVAWDALVVVVHNENPIDSISLEQLKKVYQGEIVNWSELGGKQAPIDLLTRQGKISGVGHTLRRLLFEDYALEFQSKHVHKSSGPLEQAVETNPNAIAVTGIASANKRDFKILNLEGQEPSYENIKQGNYILYRPLYMLFNHTSEHSEQSDHFIQFALGPKGREIIRKNKVVPYYDGMTLIKKRLLDWDEFRDQALSEKSTRQ